MSIAVSAVIHRSRLLRLALLCYGLLNLGAALALAASGRFILSPLLAACCTLAGLVLLASLRGGGKTRRLDISGLGQIRLTVQQDMCTRQVQHGVMQLMPGSTVWPQLMLLRLSAENGAVTVLAVLPDSVGPDQFRALAVAIRDIAARHNKFFENNKIL